MGGRYSTLAKEVNELTLRIQELENSQEVKISSTCSSQYGSDLGTGGHIEVFAKQNEVLSCRTEALIEELAAERMEAQVCRKRCEVLRHELYRLGSTEESISSLLPSSDLEENKPSPLSNSVERPGHVTNECNSSPAMEQHMLEAVLTNGIGMLAAFKEKDVSQSGNLSSSTFKDVLRKISPGVSSQEVHMVASKFEDPNTKEIQYEGVLKYFYKKASEMSLTFSLTTPAMEVSQKTTTSNNRYHHASLKSSTSTATVKDMAEYSLQLKLKDEKTGLLESPLMADRAEENELPPSKLKQPSSPVQEVLGRLSVFIMSRRAHVEALMQEKDPSLSGVISTREFSEVLHTFTEIKLSRSERKVLYDSFSQSGCIAYKEFLNLLIIPPAESCSQPNTSMPAGEMASKSIEGSKGYIVEFRDIHINSHSSSSSSSSIEMKMDKDEFEFLSPGSKLAHQVLIDLILAYKQLGVQQLREKFEREDPDNSRCLDEVKFQRALSTIASAEASSSLYTVWLEQCRDNNSLIDYDDLLDYVALQILNQFDPNLEGGKMCLRETLNDDDNEAYKQEQGEEVDWESMEKLSEDWDCTTRDADASGFPLCRSKWITSIISETELLETISEISVDPGSNRSDEEGDGTHS